MARYDFMMKKFNFVDLRNGRYILIMVRTEYDFIQPSFLEDRLNVHTSLQHIGNKSIRFQQSIVDSKNVVRVNCISVMSTYDRETGKSFEISGEWKEMLEKI